jgi:Na+/H+-dicarboxylate symporter
MNYIVALIAISIIGYIFGMILNFFSLVPIIGIFIQLILMGIFYVPFIIFSARFSSCIYDMGTEESPESSIAPGIPPVNR